MDILFNQDCDPAPDDCRTPELPSQYGRSVTIFHVTSMV